MSEYTKTLLLVSLGSLIGQFIGALIYYWWANRK